MKKYPIVFLITIIILFCSQSAHAKFNLPNFVFRFSQIEEAKKFAMANHQPIAILYSDKTTTCSLCTTASNDIIYTLKSVAVIVYAEKSDWTDFPNHLKEAFTTPQAGDYIPITLIIDSNLEKIIDIVPYKRQNRIMLINEAKKKIAKYIQSSN